MMGAKPVSESDMQGLDKVIKDMRIQPDVAEAIFAKVRHCLLCTHFMGVALCTGLSLSPLQLPNPVCV